jgi:glutamyl-tRNA(Gln) amidotransferase subunit E
MFDKWIENFERTRQLANYKDFGLCTFDDYQAIGFRCGLEVHQQLLTKQKLFCRCPGGIYHDFNHYDAEIIRHMRPTLSELGEYDGTALMEFRTKKEIVYRINKETACTYEMDDTPPFQVNREALSHALKIAHMLNLKIVGELHITRKQYLDGSIPTGFQRTTIMGIDGEIQIPARKIRLIQFSVEEDSCREVSDFGHRRVYFTDRLGMPLIETVTYPEMLTPFEAADAAHTIRYIARSTGLVRTGIGAGREDVNVSCAGGTRVEIKGVAHIKWIPRLTHNESFRQWALLKIRDELLNRVPNPDTWKLSHTEITPDKWTEIGIKDINFDFYNVQREQIEGRSLKPHPSTLTPHRVFAVNLPNFHGIMSHFTQPTRSFADEISDRLKVIACIEKPNMLHSEYFPVDYHDPMLVGLQTKVNWHPVRKLLNANKNDAQIIFWATNYDIDTAIETIDERAKFAFVGVPNETRKSRPDGISIFERVLPGPDRMYPDTDSKPVSLPAEFIESTKQNLPIPLPKRLEQLIEWDIPRDNYNFILRNNVFEFIEKISTDFSVNPKKVALFLSQHIKGLSGRFQKHGYKNAGSEKRLAHMFPRIYDLYKFIHEKQLDIGIIYFLSKLMFMAPDNDFDYIFEVSRYKKLSPAEVFNLIPGAIADFEKLSRKSDLPEAKHRWVMGKLYYSAIGNVPLSELSTEVAKKIGGA